nr:zinc finger MYM-type protein 1-like [Onthophagus taurus]
MSKKLSGYQNRKRKATRELELEKQRDDIKKYLMTKNEVLPVPSNENLREDQLPASQSHSADKSAQHTKSPEPEIEPQGASSEETLSTSTKFLITDDTPTLDVLNNLQDPATWPPINEKVRKLLIQLGPTKKQNVLYPSDDNGRKFSDTYYYRKMPSSESVPRDWLMYSEKSNSVFCFCCKLFTCHSLENINTSRLITTGYSKWQNLSQTLHSHETSLAHLNNFKQWVHLERALKSKRTIDQQQEKLFELEKQHWRAILERFIEIIKYLCKQCLPLRGKSDQLFVRNNGNFLQLVQLLAKFDVTMSSHLQKTLQKKSVHYMSKDAKYFSIILDCTPDISNTEQMTIIIRFVSTDDQVQIQEHFLGFIDIKDSTGEGLTNYIIEKIKEFNLDISNLRGQGYDNGANMKGKNNGLQRHILNINSRAYFTPCSAHSLNLVVKDAANCNHQTITFFGIVQEIYNFFSASTKRWDILKKCVPNLTLKPLSDTRWESRVEALKPLRFQIGEIYDALFQIQENEKMDNQIKCQARILCSKIANFHFVCSLVLWYDILNRVNVVSKLLQKIEMDVGTALKAINNLTTYVKNYRTDEGFQNLIETSSDLATILEIPTDFQILGNVRKRKQKRQFDYEHKDETPQTPSEL